MLLLPGVDHGARPSDHVSSIRLQHARKREPPFSCVSERDVCSPYVVRDLSDEIAGEQMWREEKMLLTVRCPRFSSLPSRREIMFSHETGHAFSSTVNSLYFPWSIHTRAAVFASLVLIHIFTTLPQFVVLTFSCSLSSFVPRIGAMFRHYKNLAQTHKRKEMLCSCMNGTFTDEAARRYSPLFFSLPFLPEIFVFAYKFLFHYMLHARSEILRSPVMCG